MVHKLGPEANAGLLAFHFLTGCDSTSYFSSKGLGIIWENMTNTYPKKQLEVMLDLSEEVKANTAAFTFVTALYCKTMQINAADWIHLDTSFLCSLENKNSFQLQWLLSLKFALS